MVAKMHRVHMPKVGEAVVHIPSGVPFEADDEQQFPLGSYMRLGNKGFVYAKSAGITNVDFGAKNSLAQKVSQVSVAADALAGALAVSLTIAIGTEITKDELVGGEIVVFPGDSNTFTRGIIGNNAIATGVGGTLVVALDSPTPVDIDTDDVGECMASPYSAVKTEYPSGNEWHPVMGMPTVLAASGKYLWLQVEGPHWAAPDSPVGASTNCFEVVFGGDGAFRLRNSTDFLHNQYAGTIIAPATGGTGQGAPFVMLQIAH